MCVYSKFELHKSLNTYTKLNLNRARNLFIYLISPWNRLMTPPPASKFYNAPSGVAFKTKTDGVYSFLAITAGITFFLTLYTAARSYPCLAPEMKVWIR
jgi:hypothetical protein